MKRKAKIKGNNEKLKQSQRIENKRSVVCLNKVEVKDEDNFKCNVCSNSFKCILKHQKSKACHKIR